MDCIFCKIINNSIPSYTIYEDDIVKVFLDINPKSNGHMLIVPKKHFLDISDIDLETLKHINYLTKKMYKLLQNKLNLNGLTVVQNNGTPQDVKHYHIHLIPKYNNDNKYHVLINIEEIHKLLQQKNQS